jgi:hypothetical protein
MGPVELSVCGSFITRTISSGSVKVNGSLHPQFRHLKAPFPVLPTQTSNYRKENEQPPVDTSYSTPIG